MARARAEALRLFVAVIPPPAAVAAVERAAAPWRDRLPDARWERPEKMHLTLRFLGRTLPSLLQPVQEACRAAADASEPFAARLEGFGVFPSRRRARVLWVGLGEGGGRLSTLAAALDDALGDRFEPERRPFTPHLTVARFRTPVALPPELDDLAEAKVDAPAFLVDRLTLVRSHLQGAKGSRYEIIAELPLGEAS